MTLTTRQKIIIPILVLILAFLAWQFYQMLFANSESYNPPVTTASVTGNQKQSLQSPEPVAFNQDVATPVSAALSQDQNNYLQLIAKYKQLQLEKLIADSNQSIAEAQLKAAQAVQQLAAITGRKNADLQISTEIPKATERYQLVYTGKIQNHWTATLRRGSELIDINIGDRLDDGAVVDHIDGDAVVLQKGNEQDTISFTGQESQIISRLTDVSAAGQAEAREVAEVEKLSQATIAASTSPAPAPIVKIPLMKAGHTGAIQGLKADTKSKIQAEITGIPVSSGKMSHKDLIAAIPALSITQSNQKKSVVKIDKKSASIKQLAVQSSRTGDAVTASEKQILSMDPKSYTIQLIASFKPGFVNAFADSNNLFDRSYQFKTKYRGKPWYALLYGQYGNIASAMTAIEQMPGSMRTYKPFVRQVKIIQGEIRQRNEG